MGQPSRAERERADISELEERAPWLNDVSFRLEGLQLAADFTLTIGDVQLDLAISYPDFFPDVPPAIVPKEPGRISGHQWGVGGELCLEHRADNWSRAITGAMMIESAYRLLSGETSDNAPPLPSAHNMSLGQEVRLSRARFLVTETAKAQLLATAIEEPVDVKLVDRWFNETWFAQPIELARNGEAFWIEPPFYNDEIPIVRPGKVLRLRTDQRLPHSLTREKLLDLTAGGPLESWVREWTGEAWLSLILIKVDTLRLFMFLSNEATVVSYKTIVIPVAAQRLPPGYAGLADKQVAIVGCGSVGSKVAVSLARSGVKRFVLIDADLFYPGNIVRNELDLRAVGANKAKAVARAITAVRADADIGVRNISLGGQEASGSTSLAIDQLANCDLIIDATADPTVFNLCALASRNEKRPMAWAQVYAGGVGGIVARSRPGIDPPPSLARAQIQEWYATRGVPWLENDGVDYDLLAADRPPLIADDADVAVIAAHLTRFCIDTLVRPTSSIFPVSAYCVGLTKSWIFDAPFDTWPIEYRADGGWGTEVEEGAAEKLAQLVTALLPPEVE